KRIYGSIPTSAPNGNSIIPMILSLQHLGGLYPRALSRSGWRHLTVGNICTYPKGSEAIFAASIFLLRVQVCSSDWQRFRGNARRFRSSSGARQRVNAGGGSQPPYESGPWTGAHL